LSRAAGAVERFSARKTAPWLLAGVFAALFAWQQWQEYRACQINFLPFSYYDYMLYYGWRGMINFTGLLHKFYHANNIMIVFAPLWKLMPSPVLLVIAHGLLAALAAVPVFYLTRVRMPSQPAAALLAAFAYLNYRPLQNVLLMNFSVEIFYTLLIPAAVLAAMKGKWFWYWIACGFGLTVKEDSFIYWGLTGLLVAFLPAAGWRERRIHWMHGGATILAGLAYFAFLLLWFLPHTGSGIMTSNVLNFEGKGDSTAEIVTRLITSPQNIVMTFLHPGKLETLVNLLYRVAFLPLATPAALAVLGAVFPYFYHYTGRDTDFIELNYQYSAAVIPFVFIALAFGWSNLQRRFPARYQRTALLSVGLALVLLNGGRFRLPNPSPDNAESIRWAQDIPARTTVVAPGHLMPYLGYRENNFFFAWHFERPEHPYHRPYSNADYYLIDLTVNPYPMNRSFYEERIKSLLMNPSYTLIKYEAGKRYLFKRR
jgi:uncharacterized membrane protein